jgi:phospholipid/cholesterol/gamma-HCH transport system ATP-binding protein
MSDKDKRSHDEPEEEGWEPPWTFGVEGEPVDRPAWEFVDHEEFETGNGTIDAAGNGSDKAGTEAGANEPAAPADPVDPQAAKVRPQKEQTIEVTALRVRTVESGPEMQTEEIADRGVPADHAAFRKIVVEELGPVTGKLLLGETEPIAAKPVASAPQAEAGTPVVTEEPIASSAADPDSFESVAEAEPREIEPEAMPRIEPVATAPEPAPQAGDIEMMIEFEDVTKRFRNQTVLRDLTFRIPRGQTVCLIGESGCGKTVNLKLMIGLIRPDKGRVAFKGEDLARMNEKKITATRIKFGFLFQMAALFDSMSIYDNVAFGLREHRLIDEKAMPDYIRERLAEVGLPPGVEWKKPAELSGGQRKRVGLARALALKPEVMLYDEPTTGLDPIMTDIINELILQTQADKNRSGIIVTHEMRTVSKCADRVIMLYPISRLEPDEPQILYDGPPGGLEDHPDPRVRQFVRGEAGERLRELNPDKLNEGPAAGIVPMDPDDIMHARPPRSRD